MPRLTLTIGACLLLWAGIGCSSGNRGSADLNPNEEAIVHVGMAYRDSYNALKRAPKGVEDLKPYLKKYGDPDKVLISPSDGQPFHIVWGVVPSRPTKGNQVFLVYEETGKNGKRYAVDIRLKVYHLTDSEFSQMQGGK
ncbi:MAG TPA: hypothetical protein VGX70_08860 [Gemmataceae bacterium]|nr:hypothetical protein [Gemmataceae bacterium]